MTGATSIKEDITLNSFNHITAELFEHTLSLEEHDENAKEFSLPETPDMISRQHNGKIEESKNAFIDKQTAVNNCRTDSSHSSPNSIKSANGEKHQVQSETADVAKNYSNGITSPLKVGGSKLTNFLLPKRTKVKGFQSPPSSNINLKLTGNAVNGNNSNSNVNFEGKKVLTASSSGSSRTGSRSNSATRRPTYNGNDGSVSSVSTRGSSSPKITKSQKTTTFADDLIQSKKRFSVPSFRFPKRSGKDAKPISSRAGSVVSLSDSRPSSSSNTFVNYNKSQQQINKAGVNQGFASRMKNLVTNRNKNVTSTKVINTRIDNSNSELTVTSAPKMTKGIRKGRKKAHESQSFDSNDGVGISRSDAAKSISEPSLAAQFSASNNRTRTDAFMREASSVASISSSSAGSKNNKKSGSKKLFRKNRNAKILPSAGQNNASDKLTVSSKAAVTTAGGVVLTGVTTYASSYIRKTGMDPRDPIFTLDVRTGNSRQVTPRQRQEIYALNRVMTRLENDRFKKFCQEKGFKGDLQVEDYDIFM